MVKIPRKAKILLIKLRSIGDVVYKNIEYSPCYRHTRKPECYQGDAECKRVIKIEDVLKVVEQVMRPL